MTYNDIYDDDIYDDDYDDDDYDDDDYEDDIIDEYDSKFLAYVADQEAIEDRRQER